MNEINFGTPKVQGAIRNNQSGIAQQIQKDKSFITTAELSRGEAGERGKWKEQGQPKTRRRETETETEREQRRGREREGDTKLSAQSPTRGPNPQTERS